MRSLLVILCWLVIVSCSNEPTVTAPNPIHSADATPSDAPVEANVDARLDADKEPDDPNVLWREGDCSHPLVEKRCDHGWCAIPSGCFVIGSPEDELGRAPYMEGQVPVTITRPFSFGQFEVTQELWTSLGLPNPTAENEYCSPCLEPTCPVSHVNWFEALAFANLASEKHDPPLSPCYDLSDCKGKPGEGMVCNTVKLTSPTVYECSGFRLPTEAEWEFAVRAGTRTANYNGGFLPGTTYSQVCNCEEGEKTLESIAWYCKNAGNRQHPVGQKMANAWGIHDALGNIREWVHDHEKVNGKGEDPLTDPEGEVIPKPNRVIRGGLCNGWPTLLRAAAPYSESWTLRDPGIGFRLARTGADTPGPIGMKKARSAR